MNDKNKSHSWKGFSLRIVLPSLIAICLFIISVYVFTIPAFEKNMLNQKREMISELTNSAWSILENYHNKEKDSLLTVDIAQEKALSEIMKIRYGKERKDYFWINDMQPKMIMHPYRTDLNGKDLSDFADPNGKKLFVDFVKIVKDQGHGYLDYMWQWKDDSTKIVPKLSYVKGFSPWGWIIGTGVYIEDVKQEIAAIENNLIKISGVIVLVIALMLITIIIQSIKTEKKKFKAEEELLESREKYRALIELTREGTIMILEDKIVYSNIAVTNILGYTSDELFNVSIKDILSRDEKSNIGKLFEDFINSNEDNFVTETRIIKKDMQLIDVVLDVSKISFGDKNGITILIRDVSKDKKIEEELVTKKEQFRSLTKNIDIGIFRTTFGKRAKFIEANPATLEILGFNKEEDLFKNNIFDLFFDSADKRIFFNELVKEKKIKNKVVQIKKTGGGIIIVSVSITVVGNSKGENIFCDGVIEDITSKTRIEEQKEQVFNELQASQYFMNQTIKLFVREIIKCPIDTSILKAAKLMNKHKRNAIVIHSDNTLIGIITDHDLRKRVVAEGFDLSRPVSEIMSAPIISIKESAFVFEAVMQMHENKLRHLCVKNEKCELAYILSSDDLRQLQVQSSSFIIKDIAAATDVEKITEDRQNLHLIVKSMIKSGANARIITGVMGSVFNLITEKLIKFAIDEIGEPPAKFAFVGLGSEGRGEETLLTDQDNAIIFEDVDDDKKVMVKEYFDKLGTKVCDWLNDIGYTYCNGDVMAKNPQWCQPLSLWQNYFTKWIATAQPLDLLEVNIFFDYNCLYGDSELTNKLRKHIGEVIQKHPQFFIYMTQNTLLYKPPLSVFGNIVLESKGKDSDTFSIKEAMIPIVSFARIYSIQNNVVQTNTLERLEILFNKQIILLSTYNEIKYAYNYLMQLRLKHQINSIDKGEKANNDIDPKQLTNIDRSMVKKVFSQIQSFQAKLNFDFKGGR
ncbi:MAG: DUF294 nucleotidyltransferase-like domain-containing protein [Bacteroidota bacterium]|nr:DUF294 nucleotidyltransferase-like domain-containing protein [Bacteroidota bacterium]